MTEVGSYRFGIQVSGGAGVRFRVSGFS